MNILDLGFDFIVFSLMKAKGPFGFTISKSAI